MITLVTKSDVAQSDTLDQSDIGKWCVIMHGCWLGFKDTYREALELERFMKLGR